MPVGTTYQKSKYRKDYKIADLATSFTYILSMEKFLSAIN